MNPKDLVCKAVGQSRARYDTWYERLGQSERKYIDSVAQAIIDNPQAKFLSVAELLVRELGLGVKVRTVSNKLQAMVNEKKRTSASE